ncbi:MAG TPA: glycosyltransferase [Steroidobacteraceae bacterium]|nr:glycosyltransferase [Steroidobacteraceae bacterium]
MSAAMLFHRHTPWQSAIRCSTNIYAGLFQDEGYDVAYMQGLVHLGHVLARRGQWQSWRRGPRRDHGGWIFTPCSVIPYANRWPFNTSLAAHLSYRSCVPSIRSLFRRSGASAPEVIWSANPGSIGLRRLFPRARFVFQVVDYYPAYSGESVKRVEREDYRGADHVFVIGETLKRYLLDEHRIEEKKITVLGQGVFCDAYAKEWPVPTELRDVPRPIGIWVGLLSKGDPALFSAAAEALRRRGGTLVLIGPAASWASELQHRADNVRVLGARAPQAVPAYLAHADLALMLYDQNTLAKYKGQNPLKLYEFAAAGLPIVSTPHEEYAYLKPPVLAVNNAEQVEGAIDEALRQRDEMRRRALEFAAAHSWRNTFQRARREIVRLLPGHAA